MELFHSLRQRCKNRKTLTQVYLATTHEALLNCLTSSAALIQRQDYQPGELHISQSVLGSPFNLLLRLFVTRNGVDIFMKRGIIPELKIVRTMRGEYMLIDGVAFHIGEVIHEDIRNLPSVLTSFHESYFHREEHHDITISRTF